MNSFVKKNPGSILFIFLILWLVYIPSIWLSFGLTDDYWYLYHISTAQDDEALRQMVGIGRPIMSLISHLAFQLIHTVSQLKILRFITITGVTLLGLFLYYLLYDHYQWEKKTSIVLTLLLCTIPSFQVFVAWSQLFPIPLALLSAGLSAFVMSRTIDGKFLKQNKIVLILFSISLLILALLFHPLAGMFYWVVLSFEFLADVKDSRNTFKSAPYYLSVWIVCVIATYTMVLIGKSFSPGYAGRSTLVHDLLGKVGWFFEEPLFRSLSVFLTEKSIILAVCVVLIAGIGLWLHFAELHMPNRLLRIGLLLALLPLSYFPNLVVTENWPSYRTQTALASLVLILLVSGISDIVDRVIQDSRRNARIKTGILSALAIFSLFSASYHVVVDFAYPQSVEWSFLKYQILGSNLNKIEQIDLIRSDWSDSLSKPVFDEFGLPSTYPDFPPEPMVQLLLKEMGVDHPIKVNIYPPREQVRQLPAHLVIDMAKIRLLRYR